MKTRTKIFQKIFEKKFFLRTISFFLLQTLVTFMGQKKQLFYFFQKIFFFFQKNYFVFTKRCSIIIIDTTALAKTRNFFPRGRGVNYSASSGIWGKNVFKFFFLFVDIKQNIFEFCVDFCD